MLEYRLLLPAVLGVVGLFGVMSDETLTPEDTNGEEKWNAVGAGSPLGGA